MSRAPEQSVVYGPERPEGINDPLLPNNQTHRSGKIICKGIAYSALVGGVWLLIAWSEGGYLFYSGATSEESLDDPLTKYIQPIASMKFWNNLMEGLEIGVMFCSSVDAFASILGVSDVPDKAKKFGSEMSKAWTALKKGGLPYLCAFIPHFILTVSSYLAGSMMPWTGIVASKTASGKSAATLGSTMFGGQLSLYLLMTIESLFATPQHIVDFFKLPREDQLEILENCFNPLTLRMDRWNFRLRTIANAGNRAWSFWGGALLMQKYTLNFGGSWYPYYAAVAAAYNTLTAQGPPKDYKETFGKGKGKEKSCCNYKKSCGPTGFSKQGAAVFVILVPVFISRTISKPALYTGPIDDPAQNYDDTMIVLAILGLISGAYASYQYVNSFMYDLVIEGGEAVLKVAQSLGAAFCSFFSRPSANTEMPEGEYFRPRTPTPPSQ